MTIFGEKYSDIIMLLSISPKLTAFRVTGYEILVKNGLDLNYR